MSFSVMIPATSLAEFEGAADRAFEPVLGAQATTTPTDRVLATALLDAVQLLAAGLDHHSDRRVSVSLSGHANVDHEPADGAPRDYVSLSMSCSCEFSAE